jgi:hypothetical protein
MAYDEQLAGRIRESLQNRPDVEEKKMFGGLCFMVDGKMCVGVTGKGDLMARIDPAGYTEALKRKGCREMDFTGRPMRGFVFVGSEGQDDLAYWLGLALEYNKIAPASKKKKS